MAAAFTETSGSLSNSAVAIAAKADRRCLIIGNTSDTVMTYRVGGSTATAAIGIPIPAGTAMILRKDDPVTDQAGSLFCAGASKTYTIYEA